MSRKRNRLLQKALDALCLEVPEEFKDISDVESFIKGQEILKTELLGCIAEAEEGLKTIDDNINSANAIIKQVEVEEIQELNPKAKVYYL